MVVDPPRTGLAPAASRALGSERVSRLVYVSCDPATFARDAAKLADAGLSPRRIAQVDMFPRCAGFELFTVWERA
ncbi:23S rRNA (uracil-C(5))-methyltransferase RlmCD [bioreactor metagenome]|uniref:23S rRNA (Uracil-C(5))-methyltransferase RlmCD n=1 Tax=bioreactor metagenome TaxID=1076179 RepID=A0A645HDH8_9ZZZZ